MRRRCNLLFSPPARGRGRGRVEAGRYGGLPRRAHRRDRRGPPLSPRTCSGVQNDPEIRARPPDRLARRDWTPEQVRGDNRGQGRLVRAGNGRGDGGTWMPGTSPGMTEEGVPMCRDSGLPRAAVIAGRGESPSPRPSPRRGEGESRRRCDLLFSPPAGREGDLAVAAPSLSSPLPLAGGAGGGWAEPVIPPSPAAPRFRRAARPAPWRWRPASSACPGSCRSRYSTRSRG